MDCYIVQNMMATGYPDGKIREGIVCENCGDETHDYYKFDGMEFCSANCIGRYIIEIGDAKRVYI